MIETATFNQILVADVSNGQLRTWGDISVTGSPPIFSTQNLAPAQSLGSVWRIEDNQLAEFQAVLPDGVTDVVLELLAVGLSSETATIGISINGDILEK